MKSVFGPKVLLLAAFTCLFLVAALPGAAFAVNEIVRVSVDDADQEGDKNSSQPSVSADGRYVAFMSNATNLVSGVAGIQDIFRRDIQTGTTIRVSDVLPGMPSAYGALEPSISGDGRFVSFTYLTPDPDSPGRYLNWIRVFDTQEGVGTELGGGETSSISADGRYVAFDYGPIYVYDMQTGRSSVVSKSPTGNAANLPTGNPSISADGRYVAFWSEANNLVPGDPGTLADIFVFDRQTEVTTCVSMDPSGTQFANGQCTAPSISADGRYVVFMSSANNLIPNDVLDMSKDIFVHDMLTGVTALVSRDSMGNKATSDCDYPSISADGRYIAFASYAFLATNDINSNMDVYVRDMQIGTTTLVSNTLEGWAASGKSSVITPDGQYVAFTSFNPYIVLNDNNGAQDVFIKDWEMGAIKMTIAPAGLIPSTTQSWCLDDKEWYNENQLVTGVTVGHHFIRFKSVTDWIQPQILHIDIPAGEITYLTGTYHQEGSLNVTIFPGAAVNAGALWTLDGVNWYPSDTTLHNLLVGQYTITYKSLDLWNTPASQTVTVKNKPVACASATYTPKPGSVKVTISPQAAIDAGARWRLDGGAWQQSGDTVNNIPIGQHTVSYLSPNGYNTVPNCVVNIYSCQTATASARYVLSPNLRVLISPQAAINAGAKWRVDSSPWQSSGASLTDLAPGPHSITFNTVANWTPPCRQIIYLTEGQPSTTTGIYTVPSTIRALRVTIEPQAAAAAGARWRVDSSPWQTSGTTLTGLSVGQHTVKFNIIPGWLTPLNKTVAISSGTTACTTGVYATIQPTGALNVTALPQAVIGKAYWRVFDGAFETPWRAAGAGPINVPAGEHTVFFSDLAGFVTPASQTVTVIAGQTLNLTGTYTIAPTTTGTLTVSLARPMAMGAQARWRVYDGPSGYSSNWLYMGARLLKVPTGQHTVVFKPVPGWVTPNDQTVTITVGQDTKATTTYTR